MTTNYLITGGNGFIGQWVIKELIRLKDVKIRVLCRSKPKNTIINFSDKKIEIINADITKNLYNYFNDVDYVIHLAGYVAFRERDAKKLYEINVQGTKNVLEASFKNNVKKVLNVGSSAMIGGSFDEKERDETKVDSKIGVKPYAKSKHEAYKILSEYKNKMHISSVYPGIVFGPGDLTNTIKYFKIARYAVFYPSGGGSVIDVRDTAKGILLVLKKGKNDEGYTLTSENKSYKEILEIICDTIKCRKPLFKIPKFLNILSIIVGKIGFSRELYENIFAYRYYSNKKIKSLGWKPDYDFKETISDAYKFYNKNDLI